MREMLFKAKSKDNGEWIEGNIIEDGVTGQVFIHTSGNSVNESDKVGEEGCLKFFAFEVNPETICQHTGLKDNYGRKICENDIVEVIWHSGKIERYLIWWSREMSMMDAISLDGICFNGSDYWDGKPQIDYSTFCLMMQDPWGDIKEVKVIGNIFDNSELLNKRGV